MQIFFNFREVLQILTSHAASSRKMYISVKFFDTNCYPVPSYKISYSCCKIEHVFKIPEIWIQIDLVHFKRSLILEYYKQIVSFSAKYFYTFCKLNCTKHLTFHLATYVKWLFLSRSKIT